MSAQEYLVGCLRYMQGGGRLADIEATAGEALAQARAEVLTETERTTLAFALDLAQDRIYSEGGFTADDQAAVDSLRRMATAGQAPAPQAETVPDSLPAWLAQRFDPNGPAWDALDGDGRAYWEHEAHAVRRAVTRNGFKTPAAQPETAPEACDAAAPARALPQIAVTCPTCGATPGDLCTSHGGTRVRKYDTHQERSAAWEAKDGDAR